MNYYQLQTMLINTIFHMLQYNTADVKIQSLADNTLVMVDQLLFIMQCQQNIFHNITIDLTSIYMLSDSDQIFKGILNTVMVILMPKQRLQTSLSLSSGTVKILRSNVQKTITHYPVHQSTFTTHLEQQRRRYSKPQPFTGGLHHHI